ncbi:MAG: DUF6064 family protein [Ignavibacteriales bacterium]|nr:DUF6064 family protein [Ignavibacteriales bacterium]
MNLPFTPDQFLLVFEHYNNAVWPLQIVFNVLGLTAIILAVEKNVLSDRLIVAILAFLWFWIGIAYHLSFFTAINSAAYVFAILNAIQGSLFLVFGALYRRLSFHFRPNVYGFTGALLLLYAMILYPLLGYLFGHVYPKAPTFGLPCPTTIFTFGLLLWTDLKVPKNVLIIPFLWSLIGFSAALKLGILEDTGLLIAGIVGTALLVHRDRTSSAAV